MTLNDLEVARLVERSEAGAYAHLIEGADSEIAASYGCTVHRLASATVFTASGVGESLMLNRAIGVGLEAAVDPAFPDELGELYRTRGVPYFAVEVGPHSKPDDLPEVLMRQGFMPFKKTVMMYRSTTQPIESAAPSKLEVRQVERKDAKEFASLCCGIFSLNQPFVALLESSFNSPCWQHWMAFDGDQPTASAMTFMAGDVAWMGWVGTKPDMRGRGAQSELAKHQIEAARAAGIRWATLEAAAGSKRSPSQSLRNYSRLGWVSAYERMVYVRRLG